MVTDASLRTRAQLARLAKTATSPGEFWPEADRLVKREMPFGTSCWHTADPATSLLTSHYNPYGEHLPPMWSRYEYGDEVGPPDTFTFALLARASRPAESLDAYTHGHPEQVRRYREMMRPRGFRDEARVSFVDGGSMWGGALFLREPGIPFRPEETQMLGSFAPILAHAVRMMVLSAALEAAAPDDRPGLIILDSHDELESMTPGTADRLADLHDTAELSVGELPVVIQAVAKLARSDGSFSRPTARTMTRSGRWLVLHASLLDGRGDGRVAVIVEPGRAADVAPLVVRAYGLTPRELDVAELVLKGASTKEIATLLKMSGYTVQDHLKSVFDKVDVRSRRELVARIFVDQLQPRIDGGYVVGSTGSLEPPASATRSQVAPAMGSTAEGA
jgi:DNA-binding CsgD family transcriptional regulator